MVKFTNRLMFRWWKTQPGIHLWSHQIRIWRRSRLCSYFKYPITVQHYEISYFYHFCLLWINTCKSYFGEIKRKPIEKMKAKFSWPDSYKGSLVTTDYRLCRLDNSSKKMSSFWPLFQIGFSSFKEIYLEVEGSGETVWPWWMGWFPFETLIIWPCRIYREDYCIRRSRCIRLFNWLKFLFGS